MSRGAVAMLALAVVIGGVVAYFFLPRRVDATVTLGEPDIHFSY